jgi:hypothetical protein
MKRTAVIGVVLAAVGVAVAAPMVGNLTSPANSADPAPDSISPTPAPKTGRQVEELPKPQAGDTPMAERIATLGILNKRNGLSRDLRMKPGQAVRIGDLVVRLKACETTADWEADQLTGAFVQVIVKNTTGPNWRKVFSGWLYKESPSLNIVQHPVYDVWTKACTMRHADVGPDTVTVAAESGGGSGRRSSAPKSADAGADTVMPPAETAGSSNAM